MKSTCITKNATSNISFFVMLYEILPTGNVSTIIATQTGNSIEIDSRGLVIDMN